MPTPVYIISDNVISPLGNTSQENYERIVNGETGISQVNDLSLSPIPFYASKINDDKLPVLDGPFTRFEMLCILSAKEALAQTSVKLSDRDTIFILSTTKGNIELITGGDNDISLSKTAESIGSYFHAVNKPVVVSNACISGVLAIITAKRLLASGKYKHAVVTGADVLSKFVVSGFQSLMAISDEPCRPFDKDRKGINLGEGTATVVMTTDKALTDNTSILVMGEGLTNDANHISGPSRTGQELSDAVTKAMNRSGVKNSDLSFVSAHGTATLYNDEMESKAFDAAGLRDVPLHSLKGYFGHTLGAAGVIETIMSIYSLRNKAILASRNFEQLGVPSYLNITTAVAGSDKKVALKTASGFGGCNVALLYSTV
ncbi:MAG: Beta-ketoacyl synthase [Bacteroidetes bacterium]|nr:Beta-ketoacyl synthase [Bacteroidota bacterium]